MTTPTLAEALRLYLQQNDTEGFGCACMPNATCWTCKEAARQRPLRAALAAHDAQPAPVAAVQAVPAGYALVPLVPTQAMCQAGQWKANEWPKFPLRISPIYQAMIAEAPTAHPIAQAAQRDELLIQLNGMIDVAERFARHMHKRGDTDERDVIQRAINAARASIEGAAKP